MNGEKLTWHWVFLAVLAGFLWVVGERLANKVWPEAKEDA